MPVSLPKPKNVKPGTQFELALFRHTVSTKACPIKSAEPYYNINS